MTTIRTVGHGTAEASDLGELLRGAGVTEVVDVRRFPGSRRHPQFSAETMAAWLPEHGGRLPAPVLVHDVVVEHLFHDGCLTRHEPTPEARRSGDHVVYDVGLAPPRFGDEV
jgi:hypothetical protein